MNAQQLLAARLVAQRQFFFFVFSPFAVVESERDDTRDTHSVAICFSLTKAYYLSMSGFFYSESVPGSQPGYALAGGLIAIVMLIVALVFAAFAIVGHIVSCCFQRTHNATNEAVLFNFY